MDGAHKIWHEALTSERSALPISALRPPFQKSPRGAPLALSVHGPRVLLYT